MKVNATICMLGRFKGQAIVLLKKLISNKNNVIILLVRTCGSLLKTFLMPLEFGVKLPTCNLKMQKTRGGRLTFFLTSLEIPSFLFFSFFLLTSCHKWTCSVSSYLREFTWENSLWWIITSNHNIAFFAVNLFISCSLRTLTRLCQEKSRHLMLH